MLCMPAWVYIYIQQLSSFRVPTLWFINLTVTTCHIRCTFLSLCKCFSWENGLNTKILEHWRSFGAQSINFKMHLLLPKMHVYVPIVQRLTIQCNNTSCSLRVCRLKRQKSSWSVMAQMCWLRPLRPQNGWNLWSSFLEVLLFCCGLVPSCAFLPLGFL